MIDYNFGDLEYIHSRCKELAEQKTHLEIPILLAEELAELIHPLMKYMRYINEDITMLDGIDQLDEELYEEISDTIVTLFQFIHLFNFSYGKIIEICNKKIDRTFETLNK